MAPGLKRGFLYIARIDAEAKEFNKKSAEDANKQQDSDPRSTGGLTFNVLTKESVAGQISYQLTPWLLTVISASKRREKGFGSIETGRTM